MRARLARGEPAVIRFWYRESPSFLVPYRLTEVFPAEHDPPASVPGMVSVELDPRGRLLRLDAVPIPADGDPGDTSPDPALLLSGAGFSPQGRHPIL